MKKIKIIKKKELDFDLSKVVDVRVDIFDDRMEITFEIKDKKLESTGKQLKRVH